MTKNMHLNRDQLLRSDIITLYILQEMPIRDIQSTCSCSYNCASKTIKRLECHTVEEVIIGEKSGPKVGETKYLSEEQEKFVVDYIDKNLPDPKYGGVTLWNRTLIKFKIKELYNIDVSLSYISQFAKRNNLTYKFAENVSTKRDPANPDKWITEHNDEFIKYIIKGCIIIYYDETGIRQDYRAQGFALIGKTPKVSRDPKAGFNQCNAQIFICSTGDIYWRLEDGKVDSNAVISAFEDISKKFPNEKLIIVLDNARWHTSHKVQRWIKSKRKIKLVYLPKYCPDINPVEYYNQYLKSMIRKQGPLVGDSLIDFVDDILRKSKKIKNL